jgi:DNA-binding response OmpR family regulator
MLSRDQYPNILVVDDEPFIVRYVQQVLQRANYRVLTATNAEEAWSIFVYRRVKIGLLLTDIVMPGPMDGLELAAKIRKTEPTLPILFMTGGIPGSDPRSVEITEEGLLLRKPFLPKQLLDFVGARLGGVSHGSKSELS